MKRFVHNQNYYRTYNFMRPFTDCFHCFLYYKYLGTPKSSSSTRRVEVVIESGALRTHYIIVSAL